MDFDLGHEKSMNLKKFYTLVVQFTFVREKKTDTGLNLLTENWITMKSNERVNGVFVS